MTDTHTTAARQIITAIEAYESRADRDPSSDNLYEDVLYKPPLDGLIDWDRTPETGDRIAIKDGGWVYLAGGEWALDEWADQYAADGGGTWHIRLDGKAILDGDHWDGGDVLLERKT